MTIELLDYRAAVKNAKNRKAVYALLEKLADEVGAAITTSEYDKSHEISVTIRRWNFQASVWLNGMTNNDAFVVPWNADRGSFFPAGFKGGNVNTVHFSKATACPETVGALLDVLRNGFLQLAGLGANGLSFAAWDRFEGEPWRGFFLGECDSYYGTNRVCSAYRDGDGLWRVSVPDRIALSYKTEAEAIAALCHFIERRFGLRGEAAVAEALKSTG